MISIVIPCKNRLNHLSSTFLINRKVKGEFEIIIVDYKCPMGTADFFQNKYPGQTINVRAQVGEREWNLSHARNIGYKASTGDALLFIDADTMLNANFLTSHILKEGEFFTGSWLHGSGCCYIWRKDFEAVKGYNEISGKWGNEDFDLYRRLDAKRLKRNYFIEKLFRNKPHSDKIRNEYHGYQNIHISNEE